MKEPKKLFKTERKVMEHLAKYGETFDHEMKKISDSRGRSPWSQFLYRIERVGYIIRGERGGYVITDKGRNKLEKEKSPSIGGMSAAVGSEEITDLSQVTSNE